MSAIYFNPVAEATDPCVVTHEGDYYVIGTAFGKNILTIQKSASIAGLGAAEPVPIYHGRGTDIGGCTLWSPILRFLWNRWYVYFSTTNADRTRWANFVLESAGTDPLGPYTHKATMAVSDPDIPVGLLPVPVRSREQSVVGSLNRQKVIGPGVIEMPDGRLYFTTTTFGLYVQAMENPWTLSGEQVQVDDGAPDLPWEGSTLEAARAFVRTSGGRTRVFMPYSSENYLADRSSGPPGWSWSVGLLVNEDGDLLNPASWRKRPQPFLHGGLDSGYFQILALDTFVSPDGSELWAVYNALDTSSRGFGDRDTFVQRIEWDDDDMPYLDGPVPLHVGRPVPAGERESAPSFAPETVLLSGTDGLSPWLGTALQAISGPYWADYRIDATLVVPSLAASPRATVLARFGGERDHYGLSVQRVRRAAWSWELTATVAGARRRLAGGELEPVLGDEIPLRLVVNNERITALADVNGGGLRLLASEFDPNLAYGGVALGLEDGDTCAFRDVTVTKERPTWGYYTGPGWTGLRINAGGPTVGDYVEDLDEIAEPYPYVSNRSGGRAIMGHWPVDSARLGEQAAPAEVYRTQRWDPDTFHHVIPSLRPGADYRLRLHFAELFHSQPGARVFDVLVNEKPVLPDFDIVAHAGGFLRATTVDRLVPASDTGHLLITYASRCGAGPAVAALSVLAADGGA